MSNYVKFWDSVDLKPLEVKQEVKDYYANPPQQNVRPLRIRIAATHAGKVTRNNGFYLPHKMKEGAGSFTKQYPKPIQVHHEDKADPIGRVVQAAYIDTSRMVRDSWSPNKVKDSTHPDSVLFDAFVEGKLTQKEIVDTATKYFIQDTSVAEDPDYEGLGYVELVADITDPVAVQKILDGRYLTGSVGASTNQAICSVCKQDWAEGDRCDHSPGKLYDGTKCVLIAGDLVYDEYSFVNKPADRHSRVIEININGVQDFVKLDQQAELPIGEIVLVADKFEEEQKMEGENTSSSTEIIAGTEIIVEQSSLEKLFGDSLPGILGTEAEGVKYTDMFVVLYESASDLEKELVVKEIKDKVLSAEDRKKLKGSTFCGPDRSYPVNDCAHAKAAMAYAKKYNESSNVIACIRRKATRLGCPFQDEVIPVVVEVGDFVVDYFDGYSDEKLLQLNNGCVGAMKERGLGCSCDNVTDNTQVKELETLLANTQNTQDSENTKVKELQERLDTVQKELRYMHTDTENLTSAMAQLVVENRDLCVAHISDLQILSGEKVDLTKIIDNFKEKSTEEIKGILKDLTEKVDIHKIADNLNSGLANKPEGIVVDPTIVIDNSKIKNEIKVAPELEKAVRFQWLQIRQQKGAEIADKFIEDCKAKGVLPAEWPIKE
jgi:hypothetical protein